MINDPQAAQQALLVMYAEDMYAQAVIQHILDGNHHAVCYAAMINYTAADWQAMKQQGPDKD